MRTSLSRRTSCLLLALFVGVCLAPNASAQSDRKELLENLLKELLKDEQQKLDDHTQPSLSGAPKANVKVSNSRQIHQELERFSRDCSDLALSLSESTQQIPGIRERLTDLYRLRARSSLLSDRTETGDQWSNLIDDVKSLDRDWQSLSYKLGQLNGLSQNQKRLVQRLDGSSQNIMGYLSPGQGGRQLNYYELTRTLAALNVDFQNLIEEVQFELGNTQSGQNTIIEIRKTQQQARHMSLLVREESGYEALNREFDRLNQLWDPILMNLRKENNRYIERALSRISDSMTAMHELLFRPHQIDRQKLLYLTSLLRKDVDEFFSRTPLKLLIHLPDSDYILPTADAFYGVCENFTDLVERGENEQQLVEAFSYITDSQEEFSRVFKPIRSQAALNVLTAIDNHVTELRTAMVIQESFDRRKAIELGASLENLSEHLHLDTQLWLSEVNVGFKNEALRETSSFAQRAAEFHRQALQGASISKLRTLSADLYENWRRVHGYISLSQGEYRSHLARLATHIGPTIVEMRTLVQQ